MITKTIKVPFQFNSFEEAIEQTEKMEQFIKTYGFEAMLQRIGQSHLIPKYRKTQGLPPLQINSNVG